MNSKTYQKAVQLLALRAHSREELRQKLLRGFQRNDVENTLDRLEELGYLDDRLFSQERSRLLRNRKNWGNYRIVNDLQRLGVDAKIVQSTIARLEEDSPENEALRRAVSGWKRFHGNPGTASKLKKLFNHCLRLGYSPESIREELGSDFQTVDWEST